MLNPSNGQTVSTLTLDNITWTDGTNSGSAPAAYGQMIVAGDGNAYIPYAYRNETDGPSSAHIVSNLMLLRVGPDGSSAKISLGNWTADESTDANSVTTCTGAVFAGQGFFQANSFSVITNAGTGAAAFTALAFSYQVLDVNNTLLPCGSNGGSVQQLPSSSLQISYVSQDALSSQVTADPSLTFATPSLQREDGSYIALANGAVMALSPGGSILWQQSGLSDPNVTNSAPLPTYATSDGGLMVVNTPPGGPLDTQFTLDANGNVTSQLPDSGARYSWTGEWYVAQGGSAIDINSPPIDLSPSYAAAAASGQNISGTGASTASVNQLVRQAIAQIASGDIGSQNWLDQVGHNQCNIFIHDVLKQAGTTAPQSDKTSMARRIAAYLGLVDSPNYPAQAGDWANPNKTLGLWKTLVVPPGSPSGTLPPDISSAGDIIAEAVQYSDATGHVGIVASIGHTISADSAVSCYKPPTPAGTITDSDYGFRPANYVDPTGCRTHGLEIHAVVKRFTGN